MNLMGFFSMLVKIINPFFTHVYVLFSVYIYMTFYY